MGKPEKRKLTSFYPGSHTTFQMPYLLVLYSALLQKQPLESNLSAIDSCCYRKWGKVCTLGRREGGAKAVKLEGQREGLVRTNNSF